MSNKNIAIQWATKQIKKATGFVYSDQFFSPFTNPDTRNKIVQELLSKGVVVWSDLKGGAFLFKKGDSRLKTSTNGVIKVGAWIEGNQILILPEVAA